MLNIFKHIRTAAAVPKIPLDEISICATFSKLAYSQQQRQDTETQDDVFPIYIDGNPRTDAQAYMWLINKKMYVCFRGTESRRDMLTNIDIIPETFGTPHIKAHSGFVEQLESVKDTIISQLENHALKYDTIMCCGHSLGGALATLAAPMFAERFAGTHAVKCYTIGAPRVGNWNFCKWFHSTVKEYYRVVNEHDPVPMVPLGFMYTHVDNVVCYSDDTGTFVLRKGDTPWYLRLFRSLPKIKLTGIIKEHDCNMYISRLTRSSVI